MVLFVQQIRITEGEILLKKYLDTATTSKVPMERIFCSNCGCSLLVSSLSTPNVLGVLAGGVDTNVAEIWKPQVEMWCRNKPMWLPDIGSQCFQTSIPSTE
jgi:hypothetical protein